MDTLVIYSKSKSNAHLIAELARKLGERVVDNTDIDRRVVTHYASETTLAKDWLTCEEDNAWKNL